MVMAIKWRRFTPEWICVPTIDPASRGLRIVQPSPGQLSAIKAVLFAVCLLPLAHLGYGLFTDNLGANPVEAVIRGLGDWALRLLLLTLAVTPLRRLSGWHWLLRLRRMFGLFVFFYALLHVLGYIWVEQFFDWSAILDDIVKRPFITVGFTAFLLLLPLAATSNNAMIRRLGGKRWQSLHRAVYAIGVLAVVHYWWMVKVDVTQPAIYAIVLAVLLGSRFYWRWRDLVTQRGIAGRRVPGITP